MAPTVWLCSHKYCVNRGKGFGIVKLQNTSLLAGVVLVENPQTEGLLFVDTATSPRLERAGGLQIRFLIQVICVENERLPFRIENTAVGFVCLSGYRDIVNLSNV
jgi:hypothetical protein